MKAFIYSKTFLIGHTDLKIGDETMGCVYGEFIPNQIYFEKIQANVWQFWSYKVPDYRKWNSLRINVQLENGYFLFPEGGYTIDDLPQYQAEPKRIDIAGLDRIVLERFFKSEAQASFVEDPWVPITIEQKILFEDELKKELSSDHMLANHQYSAECKNISNDDVLFEINHPQNHFALVHLTFTGAVEKDTRWPTTCFFESFDDFKERKMNPDKFEWDDK